MYRQVNSDIAAKAITSVKRNLCYLVPMLIVLALYDNGVHDDEKQVTAITLNSIPKSVCLTSGKPDHPAFCSVIENIWIVCMTIAIFQA